MHHYSYLTDLAVGINYIAYSEVNFTSTSLYRQGGHRSFLWYIVVEAFYLINTREFRTINSITNHKISYKNHPITVMISNKITIITGTFLRPSGRNRYQQIGLFT